MNISSLQTGAFEAIRAQNEKDKHEKSAAPKLQIQPTIADQMKKNAASPQTVTPAHKTAFLNLNGQEVGKVLDVKA